MKQNEQNGSKEPKELKELQAQSLQDQVLALTQLAQDQQQQLQQLAAQLKTYEGAAGDPASGQQFTSAFENAAIGMAVLGSPLPPRTRSPSSSAPMSA